MGAPTDIWTAIWVALPSLLRGLLVTIEISALAILVGTLLGLFIFGVIQAALIFDGRLSPAWSRIVVGALLLAFILLQRGLLRRQVGPVLPAGERVLRGRPVRLRLHSSGKHRAAVGVGKRHLLANGREPWRRSSGSQHASHPKVGVTLWRGLTFSFHQPVAKVPPMCASRTPKFAERSPPHGGRNPFRPATNVAP